ncbi:hypothetical protein ACSBR1_019215 [Camellia fascicularis]
MMSFFDEDHGPIVDHPIWYIRTVGLQPSIINSITVCNYKRGDGLVVGTDCSVCLSEFEEDETLRLLPKCNHAFHIPCIDTWLRSHTNCPMCRTGIVSNTTILPVSVPEGSVDDSVVGEEVEVVISESSGEFRREREDGDCDMRMGTEEEGETCVENGEEGGETSMEEVQPTRRSVSMDSFSASMISTVGRFSCQCIPGAGTGTRAEAQFFLHEASFDYLLGSIFSELLREYSKQTRKVAMELLRGISENLGLEKCSIKKAMDLESSL